MLCRIVFCSCVGIPDVSTRISLCVQYTHVHEWIYPLMFDKLDVIEEKAAGVASAMSICVLFCTLQSNLNKYLACLHGYYNSIDPCNRQRTSERASAATHFPPKHSKFPHKGS